MDLKNIDLKNININDLAAKLKTIDKKGISEVIKLAKAKGLL